MAFCRVETGLDAYRLPIKQLEHQRSGVLKDILIEA